MLDIMNTLKEIVDKTYFLLWNIDQTSTVYDKVGEVIPRIKSCIRKICRCETTNIITNQDIRGWLLDFLYKEKTVTVPSSKTLMSDIDEESTTIELSDVDWLSTTGGFLEINGNIFQYGAINGTTLSDIQGINWKHEAKSVINFVFMMKEELIKIYDLFDITRKKTLTSFDFREREPRMGRSYTIKPYKGKKAIIFMNCEWPILVTWAENVDEMEDDDDECGLPENYGTEIVPYIVAWELLIDTAERDKWQTHLLQGYSSLEEMYRFYATPNKKFRKKIGITPMVNYWPF